MTNAPDMIERAIERAMASAIREFWLVTKPTPDSELADMCSRMTPQNFAFLILGGLRADEIVGMFPDQESAETVARAELRRLAARLLERARHGELAPVAGPDSRG